MIDQATIEQIKNAANIVDVVADYVSLRRSGANYKGLCPFHNERTPSFIVSPSKNICHCFGCSKGGDPIRFLMDLNNYSYREALTHLANKFHIEIKEVDMTSEEIAERQRRQTYFTLCDFVGKHFHQSLTSNRTSTSAATLYLNHIGISEASVNKYLIGYADETTNSLAQAIANAGFSTSHATDLGLVAPMTDGISDVINHAIVLPVFNKTGKITSFVWHQLGNDDNTFAVAPRSAIFNPGNAVFGIHQANQFISKTKTCYIVDTPLDVITMAQNGFENTISPLGDIIDRYTLNDLVKCVKDGSVTIVTSGKDVDKSHRIFKIIDQLLHQGLSIFVVSIAESSIFAAIEATNASTWRQSISDSKCNAITWKANTLLRLAGTNTTDKIKAIQSTLLSINLLPDETSKRIYLNVLSEITKISAETLAKELKNIR